MAGPFTVFAPTNEAFKAVDAGTLNSLLADGELLKKVLTYHVVASSLKPGSLKNELTAKSLAGENLRINIYSPTRNKVNSMRRDLVQAHFNHEIVVYEAGSCNRQWSAQTNRIGSFEWYRLRNRQSSFALQ